MDTREVLRRVRRIEIRTQHLVEEVFAGQSESVFKGRGIEFSDVRPYVPGDEIRDIDWNVTARLGYPFVKRYVEEKELTVFLLVDISGSLDFGSQNVSKREMAAELGALLAFAALKNDGRVGLVLFSDQLELYVAPRRGRTQVLRVVRDLLTHPAKGTGTRWQAGLDFVNRVYRRRAVVFLLSDFLVPPDGRLFRTTGKRHDLIGLWIDDPREHELPNVGWVEFEDLETGRRRAIDTGNRRVREQYRAARSEAQRRAQQTLRTSRVDCIRLSTAESYLPPLLRYFAERRRRR